MPRRHAPPNRGIEREQLERVARIYHSNEDASRALGIVGRSFRRLCRAGLVADVLLAAGFRLRRTEAGRTPPCWPAAARSRWSGGP